MSEHPTIEEVYKRPEYFDAVWSKSIEYYCVTKQSVVCMEECAELIEAYDDRKRDGLTDGTRSHMVEEMADVLICLWLLEHTCTTSKDVTIALATRLRSERAQRSSKRSAKSCATTPKRSVWMGLPTRRRTCDAVGDAARNRKRHHGRGTRRMGGTQDGQTTAAN